ncbi:MAG: methionyl-tRNA formyltransferase, partial [Solirubrobacteraceae bacterium]|nr:methionyl-tRNA formyltransferase [Solirubrobacteraceae bacterium]
MGRTRMLALAGRALHARGHDVVLVAAPAGAAHHASSALLRELADALGAPFVEVAELGAQDALSTIADSGAEVGVSVNWPTLVAPGVLEAFAHGVLNAHAGDLPRYRGNATLGWAILSGEPELVVAVHRMDAGLDSGPVLATRARPVDDATYVGDLYAFCERVVPDMFVEVVDGLAAGTLAAVPQDLRPEASLRCFPRAPEDGWIDWSQDAASLARLVRASSAPLAGAYTALGDGRLTIWRAHA